MVVDAILTIVLAVYAHVIGFAAGVAIGWSLIWWGERDRVPDIRDDESYS